jgi:hypothetical protein
MFQSSPALFAKPPSSISVTNVSGAGENSSSSSSFESLQKQFAEKMAPFVFWQYLASKQMRTVKEIASNSGVFLKGGNEREKFSLLLLFLFPFSCFHLILFLR